MDTRYINIDTKHLEVKINQPSMLGTKYNFVITIDKKATSESGSVLFRIPRQGIHGLGGFLSKDDETRVFGFTYENGQADACDALCYKPLVDILGKLQCGTTLPIFIEVITDSGVTAIGDINIVIPSLARQITTDDEQGLILFNGEKGERGPQGEQGERGNDGLSAYDIALNNGYKNDESSWLRSLKGLDSLVNHVYCEEDKKWHKISVKTNKYNQYVLVVGTKGNTSEDIYQDNSYVVKSELDATNKRVASNEDNIAKNVLAIEKNVESISKNVDAIAENTSAIKANTDNIAENTSAIAENTSAIKANTDNINELMGTSIKEDTIDNLFNPDELSSEWDISQVKTYPSWWINKLSAYSGYNESTELDNSENRYKTWKRTPYSESIYAMRCTSIKDHAFFGATELTKVTMPLCTEIGKSAFMHATSLSEIDFKSLTEVPSYAFYNTALTSINLPQCTSIGDRAFAKSYLKTPTNYISAYISTLNIPSCKTIGDGAFSTFRIYSNLILPEATQLSDYAFYRSYTLKGPSKQLYNFYLPKVESVGEFCFGIWNETREGIEEIYAPSIKEIGGDSFAGASSLKTVYMPNVESIFEDAFYGCDKIETLIIDNVKYLHIQALKHISGVRFIWIGNVEKISNLAFTELANDSINPLIIYLGINKISDVDSIGPCDGETGSFPWGANGNVLFALTNGECYNSSRKQIKTLSEDELKKRTYIYDKSKFDNYPRYALDTRTDTIDKEEEGAE